MIKDNSESSSALALRKLNKEAEKKEAAAETMRTRCKTCFKEIAPKRLCGGHGGGGGGGDSGSASEEKASQSSGTVQCSALSKTNDEMELVSEYSLEGERLILSEQRFNPEVIAELIAKGLLAIDNNRESMTLTIKLLCEPDSLSKEQRQELKKFMQAILQELDDFKKENHISEACVSVIHDKEGNILSLSMTLPTLALYDAFIRQLANNLLPTLKPDLQVSDELIAAQRSAPTALSMEPKLSNIDKHSTRDGVKNNADVDSNITAEPEKEIFNPSPFSITLKPW